MRHSAEALVRKSRIEMCASTTGMTMDAANFNKLFHHSRCTIQSFDERRGSFRCIVVGLLTGGNTTPELLKVFLKFQIPAVGLDPSA